MYRELGEMPESKQFYYRILNEFADKRDLLAYCFILFYSYLPQNCTDNIDEFNQKRITSSRVKFALDSIGILNKMGKAVVMLLKVFALTTRGLEGVSAQEIAEIPGVIVTETSYRRVAINMSESSE